VLDRWANENFVTLDFSRPEKPTGKAFNGSFRGECLNLNWFMSLDDAMEKIQAFKDDYNDFRPHSPLCGLTPIEALLSHHETPQFSTRDILSTAMVLNISFAPVL
jgi:putative transposase